MPAIPLTMTAGVIFGPLAGTAIVSASATAAATIAFLIARYLARDKVPAVALRHACGWGVAEVCGAHTRAHLRY